MKVVHLNTYDTTGGAARSAYGLHKGLSRLGYNSSMFVLHARSNDPSVVTFQPPQDFLSRLHRGWRQKRINRSFAPYQGSCPAGCEPFRDSRSPHGAALLRQLPACNIVHLHWIAEFIDYQTFFAAVPQATTLVWTLHDMNAFTGGCHYDLGCGRYIEQCSACPQLGSSDPNDLSSWVWQDKRNAFAQIAAGKLYIVTPSRWLAREVTRSALGKHFSVSVIPYGIDTEDFAPRDRGTARDVLGIHRESRVILFLAEGIDNKRKGFSLLAQALAGLPHTENVTFVSLGHGTPPGEVRIPWLHLGFMGNDRLLSLAYSAADFFVVPSLQDNLPNTVLEALACGTPVVGFAVGGIPDMIRPGVTGLLVPSGDVAGLRAGIMDLLHSPDQLEEMRAHCRRISLEEYTLDLQAQRYIKLYEHIRCGGAPSLCSGERQKSG